MLLGIDHLVVAVADPDRAATDLEREFGLRASGGGRHEALGTFNRLVWLGDSYVELVGVSDRDRAGDSWLGRPVLAALDRGGGLATFALASDALRSDVERLQAGGSRLATPVPGVRRRDDGRTVRWLVSAPPELGPEAPPFLIEHDTSAAEWTAEDRASRALEVQPLGRHVRLAAVEIEVPAVAALGYAYVRDLELPFRPSLAGGGARDASVGRQTIRLRPPGRAAGTAPGVAIRIQGDGIGSRQADLLGCRWLAGPA